LDSRWPRGRATRPSGLRARSRLGALAHRCTCGRRMTAENPAANNLSRCPRFASGKRPCEPKLLVLMSSNAPVGTPRVNRVFPAETARFISWDRLKSHSIWQSLSSPTFMTGAPRQRLQKPGPGSSFSVSSMNDFPMSEDPPVLTTVENIWSASRGEGTRFSDKGGLTAPTR